MKRKKIETQITEIQTTNKQGKKFKKIDKEPHELDFYGQYLKRTNKTK